MLKAVYEVEDMDAPWTEGWTLLLAGRKAGHAEGRKLGTCDVIIFLLYVNYT